MLISRLGSLVDSSGGWSSCSLYDRLLPRKGRGWGLSCGPGVGWQVYCQSLGHLDGKREAALQMCQLPRLGVIWSQSRVTTLLTESYLWTWPLWGALNRVLGFLGQRHTLWSHQGHYYPRSRLSPTAGGPSSGFCWVLEGSLGHR